METLKRLTLRKGEQTKHISVLRGDIAELDLSLDVMSVSAFVRHYAPLERTMIGALFGKGISVQRLSKDPEIDLRDFCSVWLSREIGPAQLPVRRIGCIELLSSAVSDPKPGEDGSVFFSTIRSYFCMLELASHAGVPMERIGLPLLGTGNQGISDHLIMIPIIQECLRFLERNEFVREIYLIEQNEEKARKTAALLEQSYSVLRSEMEASALDTRQSGRALAFISYSSKDRSVADDLCAKLERDGIRAWYAPRDIDASDYASSIVNAISRCTHFIVIISRNSLQSEHVLNEIDLAFQEMKRGVRFYPIRLDREELSPAFRYYLSRQHWTDACCPPLEQRLEEFVRKIRTEADAALSEKEDRK